MQPCANYSSYNWVLTKTGLLDVCAKLEIQHLGERTENELLPSAFIFSREKKLGSYENEGTHQRKHIMEEKKTNEIL